MNELKFIQEVGIKTAKAIVKKSPKHLQVYCTFKHQYYEDDEACGDCINLDKLKMEILDLEPA